ncbi:MAG TPA: VWA domain-containing protein [Terriglobales bacterium]|nr:VWA domain-containing protein [Terriglobales bacterium]
MAPAQTQSGDQQKKPSEQAPAEAGGPQGDIGPIIVPKKKPEEAPPPPQRQIPKNPEGMPDFSLRVDVQNVQVPVLVTTKEGGFLPGLKKENFRVYEDGVPQTITDFRQSEAPITAVLLIEFANINYWFMYDAINASYAFANSLKPEDWVAVITFDNRPFILADFTQDKREIYGAIRKLQIPGFSETNVFDALYDTLDRLEGIQGRKYVILISRGIDTFSKLNYDKILKKVKETRNVGIYTISTGEAFRIAMEARYGNRSEFGAYNMDYLQADNQMRTFANLTGAKWYKPRFEGELPEIFQDVAGNIRNQYLITYKPTNAKQDGTYRKLKVELVAPDGGPLTVKNQKGKTLKAQVIAREGYTAKHEVE